MMNALDISGIDYVAQFRFMDRVIFDFAIPDKKVAIECDGSYWHNLPHNRQCDGFKWRLCHDNGWILLRFDENTINNDIVSCIRHIQGVIKCE